MLTQISASTENVSLVEYPEGRKESKRVSSFSIALLYMNHKYWLSSSVIVQCHKEPQLILPFPRFRSVGWAKKVLSLSIV